MIIQYVKFRTGLSEEDLLRIAHERSPQFRVVKGLLQKYYVRGEAPGEFGGIYVWDSAESLAAFRESNLAGTIASAYQVEGAPEFQTAEVLFPLRDSAVDAPG